MANEPAPKPEDAPKPPPTSPDAPTVVKSDPPAPVPTVAKSGPPTPVDPTLIQAAQKGTPAPGKPASAVPAEFQPTMVYSASAQLSVATQDLTKDNLLSTVGRTTFDGRAVPVLGGIPILAKLGQGGMGAVYFGIKTMLKQEVAVKVLPVHLAQQQPQLVERFLREAQIAAKVESPHLVRVTDVNEEGGLFYLVMEYISGISAGTLLKQAGPAGLDETTVLEICIAATDGLSTAHAHGVIHRDVKPDNILVPRGKDGALSFTKARLADLGLARADEIGGSSLTGAQSAMGTPGFMAPEQARNARKAGKSADIFSMGATLYALLAGRAPFKGETATETLLACIQTPHVPIKELRPNLSAPTIELIERCLVKNPTERFVDGAALLQALRVCRMNLGTSGSGQDQALAALANLQQAAETGQKVPSSPDGTPMPNASTPVPAGTPVPGSGTPVPNAGTPIPATGQLTPMPGAPGNSGTTAAVAAPRRGVSGLVVVAVLFLALAGGGIWYLQNHNNQSAESREARFAQALREGEHALDRGDWPAAEEAFRRALNEKPNDSIALQGLLDAQSKKDSGGGAEETDRIKLALPCSPEKIEWLKWALKKFAETPEGKGVDVSVVTMNAEEGMQALLAGDERFTLWSPGSNLYRDSFVTEWKAKRKTNPILREEDLSFSPMVFVMFEDRFAAFEKKYGKLSFATLAQAYQEKNGWAGIAAKPEWGRFTFALTNPAECNSGLAVLAMMSAGFQKEDNEVTEAEIRRPEFQTYARQFVRGFNVPGSASQCMKNMVLKGPSAFDGVCTYECVAIDNLMNLSGRWGKLKVVYPEYNFWNDNPMYVLDVPWSSEAQRAASGKLLDFLMSEPMQAELLKYGFRPGNPKIPLLTPDSPFVKFEKDGIKIEVAQVVVPPMAPVVRAMVDSASRWVNGKPNLEPLK